MPHSEWYANAAEQLVTVVQSLSEARSVEAIMTIVKNAARDLTGADGATFVLRDGDKCYYAEENAIAPLWKGKRFPMETCISGWVMMNATHAAIEDIYQDPRIPADAYRPTFVKSLVMVPIRRDAPIGAIGNYWASHHQATEEEIAILQALADTTSVALENVRLYENLQEKIRTLETREEHMREQQESLEIFTRALAHDLKEPMRTIHSFSEIIKLKENLSEKGAHYFRHIEESSKRMLMLIDTVFQYTQIDDPKQLTREAVDADDITRIAKENLSQLIKERKAVIESADLPAIMVNKMQAVQLFQNLIGNAITHNTDSTKIQLSARRYKEHWEFAIEDNGQGVEPEHIKKIFDPFKRVNQAERGAGLGLSICRKIVELHGGRIRCESEFGKGASFYFTLPAATLVEQTPERVASMEQTKKNSATSESLANVLIVDDRESDLELTQFMLQEKAKVQCNVTLAHGGQEALSILRDKNQPVDLVLLDINMPGLDGFEILDIIRKEKLIPQSSVIMCTGSTYEQDILNAKAMGAAGYLVKPAGLMTLEPIINQIDSVKLQAGEGNYRLLRAA